MSAAYDKYLESDYWKQVSKAVKARANYRCQLCNSQHELIAHHRTYDHRGKELDHLYDLTCLCRNCHDNFHGRSQAEAPIIKKTAPLLKIVQVQRSGQTIWSGRNEPVGIDVESEMPNGDGDIVLTRGLVRKLTTIKGAFTKATAEALGVSLPFVKGWSKRLVGTTVCREKYKKALIGRHILTPRWGGSGTVNSDPF